MYFYDRWVIKTGVSIMSRLKEECGVFGMIDLDGNNVNNIIYYGLFL